MVATGVRLRLAALLTAAALVAAGPPVAAAAPGFDPADPATWSNRRLAAQLTFSCVAANDLARARRHAAAGVGGITLLGPNAPRDLRTQLARVGAAASAGVRPFVASDEEGGAVQRLRHRIYPLPSARTMGTWPAWRIRSTARDYGRRMRALGVTMDFAPVADLAVRGAYLDSLRRAFSPDAAVTARKARAWRVGLQDAGVVPVLKHWPGHGHAGDTHTADGRVPPLTWLERHDMVPFDREFERHVPMVMVGHLQSAGLTERGVPATQSPRALRYLRARAGPQTVIITDSLTMAAASSGIGISSATAAVRALRAGADWALVCTTNTAAVVDAIHAAINRGSLPRHRAVTSARRILALKAAAGLLPG